MQSRLSLFGKAAAAAALVFAALGSAQARDVYWSVGIDAAPGVSVGVGNHRPVVVHPQPVYVQPAPVVVAPAPVYGGPVYYSPPQVVYTQPRVVYPSHYAPVVVYPQHRYYYGGGHGHHKHHKHHWKEGRGHGHGGHHWR
jgi:hypothetical protein